MTAAKTDLGILSQTKKGEIRKILENQLPKMGRGTILLSEPIITGITDFYNYPTGPGGCPINIRSTIL